MLKNNIWYIGRNGNQIVLNVPARQHEAHLSLMGWGGA